MVPSYRVSAQLALVLAGILVGFVLGSTDAWRPSGARAPIPELSSLSCDNQNWTETDVCLTWTAPLASAQAEALVVLDQAERVAEDSTGTAGRTSSTAVARRLRGARARVPEPPPLPCNMQNWTEGERVCLSWTAPLEAAKAEALAAPGPSVRGPSTSNTGDTIR